MLPVADMGSGSGSVPNEPYFSAGCFADLQTFSDQVSLASIFKTGRGAATPALG
jgi:hypothetical protein